MFNKENWDIGHGLKVEPDSEAEEYIIKTIMPLCKDNVVCRLGALFGDDFNEYIISDPDYKNLTKEISFLKGGAE